ncbi:TioE family transcriptional regulator [Paenibacillus sp. NPDC058071]|uniref:TioE family transcriptional regulator n=1 Tax=Paenibacillus sp. NPDC058071 TaxID=3346326 RepID=UPI0036D88534
MRYYKPIEIAKKLHISTSALRHYESWGVVPAPERAYNGYRLYTSVHLAYFRCLRAMFPGFGIAFACKVLVHIQHGRIDDAFWLVNKEQADLQHEKTVASETLKLLQDPELPVVPNKRLKPRMSIGEAAKLTDVLPSAIRHWEKEGLLAPERDPDNGYRFFTPMHIRQILLIRTLRRTVYYLDNMKEIVQAAQHYQLEKAKKLAEDALVTINVRNRNQLSGIHQLVELCKEVGLLDDEPSAP